MIVLKHDGQLPETKERLAAAHYIFLELTFCVLFLELYCPVCNVFTFRFTRIVKPAISDV